MEAVGLSSHVESHICAYAHLDASLNLIGVPQNDEGSLGPLLEELFQEKGRVARTPSTDVIPHVHQHHREAF
jgi:hypothetical protein